MERIYNLILPLAENHFRIVSLRFPSTAVATLFCDRLQGKLLGSHRLITLATQSKLSFLIQFFKELISLLEKRLPFVQAIRAISDAPFYETTCLVKTLASCLELGLPFLDALAYQPDYFADWELLFLKMAFLKGENIAALRGLLLFYQQREFLTETTSKRLLPIGIKLTVLTLASRYFLLSLVPYMADSNKLVATFWPIFSALSLFSLPHFCFGLALFWVYWHRYGVFWLKKRFFDRDQQLFLLFTQQRLMVGLGWETMAISVVPSLFWNRSATLECLGVIQLAKEGQTLWQCAQQTKLFPSALKQRLGYLRDSSEIAAAIGEVLPVLEKKIRERGERFCQTIEYVAKLFEVLWEAGFVFLLYWMVLKSGEALGELG